MKGPDDLAGAPRVAGEGSDLAIGGHASPGDGTDQGDNLADIRVVPAFHFLVDVPLMYVLNSACPGRAISNLVSRLSPLTAWMSR